MIDLEVEIEEVDDPDAPLEFPKNSMWEYSRFGEKIMIYPKNEVFVKECFNGRVVPKRLTQPFRRDDRGNFYYKLRTDPTPKDDSSYDLIPSTWGEDQQ